MVVPSRLVAGPSLVSTRRAAAEHRREGGRRCWGLAESQETTGRKREDGNANEAPRVICISILEAAIGQSPGLVNMGSSTVMDAPPAQAARTCSTEARTLLQQAGDKKGELAALHTVRCAEVAEFVR
eukprot:Skav211233  [mRNA]  locus=scaffold180:48644:51016:- [translate_table: standard]